jgi:hypothetical protein
MPFGTSIALFVVQTETIEVSVQELNVTRTHITDYFTQLHLPERNEIFSWEKSNYMMNPERSSIQFVSAIAAPTCSPANV